MQKVFSTVLVALVMLAGETLAQTFTLKQTFHNPTPASADQFGNAVAAVGNKILVGARNDDTIATNAGAVYLFDATSPLPQLAIVNPNSVADAANDLFGSSVAAFGNNLLVGAPGANGNFGEVYLFNGITGAPMLTISNPSSTADQFGFAVTAVGNNILIGAPLNDTDATDAGIAYLFDASGNQLAIIHNPFPLPAAGIPDQFGSSVAAVGSNALIGAPGHDEPGFTNAGAAYLFNGTTGAFIRKFTNPNPGPSPVSSDQFGGAVAGVGAKALIGSAFEDTPVSNSGVAYLFDINITLPIQTFENPTPGSLDQFSFSVAAFGNNALAVIGAPLDDTGASNTGVSYLYDVNSTTPLDTLLNPALGLSDQFGTAIAAGGTSIIIAAPFNDTGASDAGAVYLFKPPPVAHAGDDKEICSGRSVTIGGAPTATDGTPPYAYSWTPTAGLDDAAAANPNASPTSTIEYTVQVTDAAGSTATDQVTVTVIPSPAAHAGNDRAICAGQSVTLGDNPAATGGTPPYTFSWTPTTGLDNATAENPNVSPTGTTQYTVEVTDAKGCTATDQVMVTVNPLPTANVSGYATICAGGSTIIFVALTGTSPWNLTWSDDSTQNGITTSPAERTVSPASMTTYTVTNVTDANTCSNTGTGSATITVNPLPTANISGDATICAGGSATISAALAGTPPWNLTWSDDFTQNDVASSPATRVVNPATTTAYTVTVTDASNCSNTGTGSATITVKPLPTVSISGNDAVVIGTTHTYTANTNASNPIYNWSVTNGTINGSNTNSTASLTAGSVGTMVVNLTVTDGLTTCSNSATKNVTVNPTTLLANAGNDGAICIGAAANLNGTASGGDGSYTFSWTVQSGPNTSSSQFNDPTLEDPIFTPTLSGTYVLRFTVDDGVVAPVFDDVQITMGPLPIANAGLDKTVSSGQTVQIGGSPTGSGGTPPFTYSWTPTTGLDNPSAANPNATVTSTTTYSVTVTDANNCIATDQVQVNVEFPLPHPFVLLAKAKVTIDHEQQSEGDIHSNDKIEFKDGNPSIHTGNLTAVGDITINKNNTIAGNVKAGGKISLSGNATITGTAISNTTVTPYSFPTFSFNNGTNNVTVPPSGSLSLAPGSYYDVKVENGGNLVLSNNGGTGEYFFHKLELQEFATLSVNVSQGPVKINLVQKFHFAKDMKVVITPAVAVSPRFVTFNIMGTDDNHIHERSIVLGNINAPNGKVTMYHHAFFKGAVAAKEIEVEDHVTCLHHNSAGTPPLAKTSVSAAGDAEESNDSECSGATEVKDYALEQNYPNPFNPETEIRFALPEASHVTVKIFNTLGETIRTLADRDFGAGMHAVRWNAQNERGEKVPSGMYFYRLVTPKFTETKKMILAK